MTESKPLFATGAPAVFVMNETLEGKLMVTACQPSVCSLCCVERSYCIDNAWTMFVRTITMECIQQGGCEMTLSAYLSAIHSQWIHWNPSFEPMDDLIIPGNLIVNQNITVGGGFAWFFVGRRETRWIH